MFRLWGKLFANNHLLKDDVICNDTLDTRTHKVFHSLTEICNTMDLENPIWLDKNVTEFQRHSKTRFYQDSFIEQVPFDFLEIEVIEED